MTSSPLRHVALPILLLANCRACNPSEDSPEPDGTTPIDDTAPTDDSGPTDDTGPTDGPIIVEVQPTAGITITSPTTSNRTRPATAC